jgi:hypothetical protein
MFASLTISMMTFRDTENGGGQFFSTCRIQRSALEFRLLQNSVLWRNHGLKFLIPFYSLLIFGGELTMSFCGSCTLIK